MAEAVAPRARAREGGQGVGTVESLRVFRAVRKMIRERRAEIAKDRAGFGRLLIGDFARLGDVLADAANFMLMQNGTVRPELVEDFRSLFSFWNFAIFQPLADDLTYDEEEQFRAAMGKVREGWRLFLGVCRLKFPGKEEELSRGEELAIACTDFVEDFFLGEIETELTDEYNVMSASLARFIEQLKGYFE